MHNLNRLLTILALTILMSATPGGSAQAAGAPLSPELKEGIIAYNKGDYQAAVMSLTGALTSEYNNAVVHYYLGNCFVKLNQPESAVREFRIAYAISPSDEVGKFSKEALKIFGIDSDDSGPSPPTGDPATKKRPDNKPDPALEQAIKGLRNQTFFAKSNEVKANETLNRDAERRAQEEIERTKSDIMKDNSYYNRHGKVVQKPMSTDSQKLLDNLKNQFDSQITTRKKVGDQRVDELQQSANNLESLLTEQRKGSGPKLKPTGTNLYIRNYEQAKPKLAKPPADAEVQDKPRDDNPFSTP